MEGRQFNRRTLAILVVLTALLLLFFGVLYNLQVLHVDDYRAQSVVKIANRKTVEAARGELLDRYGRSMVTNRATYQLTLNTGVMGEEAVRNANLLELLNICRDNGQSAVAGQLEVFCKITIAALGMPVVLTLFEVVTKCIG